jgi:hypothetical protein
MDTNTQKTQIARINRRLAKQGYEKLRASRSRGELQNLGNHYVVDTYTNTVTAWHVNLDEFEAQILQAT